MGSILPFEFKTPKIEFGQLYTRCVEITGGYKPVELMIESSFNLAKNNLPLAAELRVADRKLPLTAEQKVLLNKLYVTSMALLKHLRALNKVADTDNGPEVSQLCEYVKNHISGLSKENMYKQTGLLANMLDGIERSESLKLAVTAVGVGTAIEKLKADKAQLDEVYNQRRKAISEIRKARSVEVKQTLNSVLRQLFSAIELAQIEHPELDYKPLISELNRELSQCATSSKPRTQSTTTNPTAPEIDQPGTIEEVI